MAKRKYGKNIAFMMEFVRKFIDEELSRFDITCDFNHHIIQRYDDMYDENPEIAEIIGIPLGTVYSRLRLARKVFQQEVKKWVARTQGRKP